MPITRTISPAQSDITTAIGTFLQDVTGYQTGQVIVGQPNRVPQPTAKNFIIMMPTRFQRMSTNYDTPADSLFTATSSGTTLDVTAIQIGDVPLGALLFGVDIPPGISIDSQLSGAPGDIGTYQLSTALEVATPQAISAGGMIIRMDSTLTMQLDFHSDDNSSAQQSQSVSMLLRDQYGVAFFAALPPPQNVVVPLFADDPGWRPFINAEGNYEWRWVIEARFEVNQTLRVPQQFADALTLELIAVPWQVPGL